MDGRGGRIGRVARAIEIDRRRAVRQRNLGSFAGEGEILR
ncbi:hypothetical protein L532_2902 [Bordetella bronchiseptica OSU095]|nr:hypothetical protein L532_2902 [Bordetella bronchiseptica OSU095]